MTEEEKEERVNREEAERRTRVVSLIDSKCIDTGINLTCL